MKCFILMMFFGLNVIVANSQEIKIEKAFFNHSFYSIDDYSFEMKRGRSSRSSSSGKKSSWFSGGSGSYQSCERKYSHLPEYERKQKCKNSGFGFFDFLIILMIIAVGLFKFLGGKSQ